MTIWDWVAVGIVAWLAGVGVIYVFSVSVYRGEEDG